MSERFKQSIDRYYQNRKNLEYLDLATEPVFETESIEGIKFSCYKKGFKHAYHSENKQLNFICDLQLNTLHNISVLFDRLIVLSNVCLKHFYIIHENFEKFEKILNTEELEKKLKRIPTKSEVSELINSIINQPKKVERETVHLTQKLEKKLQKIEVILEQLHKQWT